MPESEKTKERFNSMSETAKKQTVYYIEEKAEEVKNLLQEKQEIKSETNGTSADTKDENSNDLNVKNIARKNILTTIFAALFSGGSFSSIIIGILALSGIGFTILLNPWILIGLGVPALISSVIVLKIYVNRIKKYKENLNTIKETEPSNNEQNLNFNSNKDNFAPENIERENDNIAK